MKNTSDPLSGSSAFNSSSRTPDNYVPAILRDTQNQGSSLDMFKETNKGAVSMDENAAAEGTADASKDKPVPEDKAGEEAKAPAPEQGNMAQQMMGKLAGGFGGGLSSSMGSGGGKVSNMGGFGNKFNTGATGGKSSGFGNLGAGFQTSPKFDQRKKLLAMNSSKRPVFSNAKGAKGGMLGKGAFAQAKGLRSTQKTTAGSTGADGQRSTQDKAWEGSTPDGTTAGGAGVSGGTGGSGIVTSPSLDNTSSSGGSGGTTPSDTAITETPTAIDVSPWAGLPQKAMMYIMLSAMLSVLGAWVIKISEKCGPYAALVRAIGMIICALAMALGAMALMIGVQLMSSFGQGMLGGIYMLGGGVAIAAGVMAMTGKSVGPITPLWMAAIAGILGMLGGMAGGK